MISTRKKSPFFALARSRAPESFKPTRTPQEGGFIKRLGREGGRIRDLWGPSGVILVQQRSAAGDFREPKRRGVIAVFEGGERISAPLVAVRNPPRKKKSID